ncbi:MAG TPA: pirin-like C-terminal cupin domain-containing protein, partial [Devosia sp.]
TAGKGIVHSEMFPLLNDAQPNPLELFQIWLNLPASSKMSEPYFTMLWSQDLPRMTITDGHGRLAEVAVVAGRLAPAEGAGAPVDALPPPPSSWAAQAGSDVAIWTSKLEPGAQWTLPAAEGQRGTRRMLYFFKGSRVTVAGQAVTGHAALELRAGNAAVMTNTGADTAEFLLLQGRPIAEPVVQYGPFVMNTQAEIAQTMAEYQRTQFGGWSFDQTAPVHGKQPQRFARHPDGRVETPDELAAGAST